MISFLRQVRRALLDSGSPQKYFLYALGEIALVVIGILIALQINNWNEWRKDRAKEESVLLEIRETLDQNLETLEYAKARMSRLNLSSNIVLDFLNESLEYSDTLAIHFDYAKWSSGQMIEGLSDAGYLGLSNLGFDILRNKELRKEIVRLFSKAMPLLVSSFNLHKESTYANYDQFIRTHFVDLGGHYATPLDPEMIRQNNYYRSIIMTLYDHRIGLIRRTQKFHDQSIELIKLIDIELDQER